VEIKIRELSAPTAFCAGSYLAQLDGERFFIQLGHDPKPEDISRTVSEAIASRRKLQKLIEMKKKTAEICGNVKPEGFIIGKGGARIKHLSMLHGDRLSV